MFISEAFAQTAPGAPNASEVILLQLLMFGAIILVFYFFIIRNSVSAMSDGVGATPIPAARNASIFAAAVPFPPEMIAPA